MSAITAKASRKMKKYAVLTREPRCFLGSFDFSWEQRKLGDIVERVVRKNTNNESSLPLTISAQYGLVDQITYFNNRVASRDVSNYYLVLNGEFAYNKSTSDGFPFGAVKRLDLYEKGVLSTLYIVFSIKNQSEIDSDYLTVFFDTDRWHKGVSERAAEGARNHGLLNISADDFFDIDIFLPRHKEEQVAIGSYLRHLDHLITLHQRKCALIFSSFQALISMMFTTSTFSWEQRKLGEIGSVSMCRRIFKEQTSETGDIPFYKIGTFGAEPDAFISRELFEEYKSKYPYPKKGDILISASGSIGRTVEFAGNNEYFQDSNIVWLSHDERLSNSFLKCFYSVVKWAGIEGSTIKRLYNDNILNTVICMPSVPEQEHIGLFFENLDNLITLHQRQPFLHSTPEISLTVQLIHPFYTSSWEQRKAIDIADYSKGNGYSKGDLTDAGTPIILYGRLYTKYQFAISEVDTFAFPRNGAVYSQGNEVIVPASGETAEDIARASAVEKSGVLLGGDLNILRPFDFINPLFLALAISNGEPQKELAKKAQGKSVVHIHNTDIQEVTIAYPSRTEQDRIVSVFRQLDNLITLHQRKGKAAVTGCSNDANNSKGVYCKARDFGYKCYKKVKSQQIRCLIAVFIFFV